MTHSLIEGDEADKGRMEGHGWMRADTVEEAEQTTTPRLDEVSVKLVHHLEIVLLR